MHTAHQLVCNRSVSKVKPSLFPTRARESSKGEKQQDWKDEVFQQSALWLIQHNLHEPRQLLIDVSNGGKQHMCQRRHGYSLESCKATSDITSQERRLEEQGVHLPCKGANADQTVRHTEQKQRNRARLQTAAFPALQRLYWARQQRVTALPAIQAESVVVEPVSGAPARRKWQGNYAAWPDFDSAAPRRLQRA